MKKIVVLIIVKDWKIELDAIGENGTAYTLNLQGGVEYLEEITIELLRKYHIFENNTEEELEKMIEEAIEKMEIEEAF